jgi:hypothetical protein
VGSRRVGEYDERERALARGRRRVPRWPPWGERAGCLLISSGGSLRGMKSVARLIPKESGRLTVIMDDADPAFMLELGQRLRRWVPQRWASVRLVAAGAAAASGDECAARQLSDFLGAEVLAPDGELVVVPDGSLFVAGHATPDEHGQGGADNSAGPGAWWRFQPGRPPARVGRRYPVPSWEADIGRLTDPGIAGVVVEEVPCGLWLHRPAPIRTSDLAYSVPVLPDNVMLLVSRPGDSGLHASDVRRFVEAVPEALCDRLIVVPYGDTPLADGQLGAVASLAAKRTLRVRTGLPLVVPDKGRQVVAVGANGVPTWRPFAREMAWRPDGGGWLKKWILPVDHLVLVGPGQLALDKRWLVEVTESGLWVRENDRIGGAALVRGMPLESSHCTVVVSSGESPIQPPWRAIAKLLRKLPEDARSRLRLAVPETKGNWMAHAAASVCRRVLRRQSVVLLMGDGTMTRWPPSAHPVRSRPSERRAPW